MDVSTWKATLVSSPAGFSDPEDRFGFAKMPPCWDFNREIAAPGVLENYPDGAVAIRCDDDFWIVAVLPYEFRDVSCPEIVSALWPHVTPSFNPDTEVEKPVP